MMTFKEKLVVLRKIKHLTQDEFASAVGVSRQAVYKWESGQSYPEVQKLIEMKLLFGISIDDLLDDTFEIELPKKKRKRRSKKTDAESVQTAETNIVKEELKAEPETAPVAAPAPVEEEKPEPPKTEVKSEPAPKAEPVVIKEEPKSESTQKTKTASDSSERKTTERTSLFERLFGNKK